MKFVWTAIALIVVTWTPDAAQATGAAEAARDTARLETELVAMFARYEHNLEGSLLGICSHMIDETLYLPDDPIGHLIAFQVEAHERKR